MIDEQMVLDFLNRETDYYDFIKIYNEGDTESKQKVLEKILLIQSQMKRNDLIKVIILRTIIVSLFIIVGLALGATGVVNPPFVR